MLFYTYDLEKYRDVLRGFYIDIEEELPGPLLFTTEEIINALRNIEQLRDRYKDKYDAFYEKFCAWEDGHASDKVADTVFDLKKTE
jgi:CDP-glycerol glycerophosphotransferase